MWILGKNRISAQHPQEKKKQNEALEWGLTKMCDSSITMPSVFLYVHLAEVLTQVARSSFISLIRTQMAYWLLNVRNCVRYWGYKWRKPDRSVATNILHPTGLPGPGSFHISVPQVTYEITTLRLNINHMLFGLLA